MAVAAAAAVALSANERESLFDSALSQRHVKVQEQIVYYIII